MTTYISTTTITSINRTFTPPGMPTLTIEPTDNTLDVLDQVIDFVEEHLTIEDDEQWKEVVNQLYGEALTMIEEADANTRPD